MSARCRCGAPMPPVPDLVQSKLNDARAEVRRLLCAAEVQPGIVDTRALATADALLAIVVAVESLKSEVRR